MHAGFAYEMQKEAERLSKPFEDQIYGVKCWYSAARLFDQKAERVFVSINPGGAQPNEQQDKELPYVDPDYNAWLDEDWSGPRSRGPEHQRRVWKVFERCTVATDRMCYALRPASPLHLLERPASRTCLNLHGKVL